MLKDNRNPDRTSSNHMHIDCKSRAYWVDKAYVGREVVNPDENEIQTLRAGDYPLRHDGRQL